VFSQYLPAEGFNFAEGYGFKCARPFKAKGEAAYSAEKIEQAQLGHAAPVRIEALNCSLNTGIGGGLAWYSSSQSCGGFTGSLGRVGTFALELPRPFLT
jgi:hypothetical protein